MRKKNIESTQKTVNTQQPALSREARENQMVALAIGLAEKQLIEGTASSQVITHYLKLGSTMEREKRNMMVEQRKLLEAKTEALQSSKRVEELYANALNAMREYSGKENEE